MIRLLFYDTTSFELTRSVEGLPDSVNAVGFHPHSALLIVACGQRKFVVDGHSLSDDSSVSSDNTDGSDAGEVEEVVRASRGSQGDAHTQAEEDAEEDGEEEARDGDQSKGQRRDREEVAQLGIPSGDNEKKRIKTGADPLTSSQMATVGCGRDNDDDEKKEGQWHGGGVKDSSNVRMVAEHVSHRGRRSQVQLWVLPHDPVLVDPPPQGLGPGPDAPADGCADDASAPISALDGEGCESGPEMTSDSQCPPAENSATSSAPIMNGNEMGVTEG